MKTTIVAMGLCLGVVLVACGSDSGGDNGGNQTTNTGGTASGTGGSSSSTGGTASGTGGASSSTGGTASGTGGASSSTGGAANTGGTSSSTGGAANTGGSGTNPEAGIIKCGSNKDVVCNLPANICCQGLNSAECKPAADKCGMMTATVKCDGPEDCSGSEMCCAKIDMGSFSASATCLTQCAGTMQEAIMCHTATDCTGGKTCKECKPPGGPAQMMCVANDTCPN